MTKSARHFSTFCLVVMSAAALLVCSPRGAAQDASDLEGELPRQESQKKADVVLSESELERIQRRLDQLAEHSQKLRQAIDEIKAELAIIQVRVTN